MFYTLPQAIKEEKKDEERVGISKSEKREGWKTESEEEKTREKIERSLRFSCFFFIFCLRHYRERVITGEWGFLFVRSGERTERVSATLRACFHLGRERLGCRGPPWSFFLPHTCICIFIYSDFMNDERCV